jgi:hypothetical protein
MLLFGLGFISGIAFLFVLAWISLLRGQRRARRAHVEAVEALAAKADAAPPDVATESDPLGLEIRSRSKMAADDKRVRRRVRNLALVARGARGA